MKPALPFYVISDTHFFHKNIIKYCGRPNEHEILMIARWQRVVKHTDTVVHLGDLFFGGDLGYEKFCTSIAPRLTGHRKYIILGNHDKKKYDYERLGFRVIKPFTLKYRGYDVSFDHYPTFLPPGEKRIHVHGHIHNHSYAKGEEDRPGNINISVEVMDYRPHRMTRLLNKEIRRRNQTQRYTNSRHYRAHNVLRNRRNVGR